MLGDGGWGDGGMGGSFDSSISRSVVPSPHLPISPSPYRYRIEVTKQLLIAYADVVRLTRMGRTPVSARFCVQGETVVLQRNRVGTGTHPYTGGDLRFGRNPDF